MKRTNHKSLLLASCLLAAVLMSSCATPKGNYTTAEQNVELIDGHEYFVVKNASGGTEVLEHKADCTTCENYRRRKTVSTGMLDGVLGLFYFLLLLK